MCTCRNCESRNLSATERWLAFVRPKLTVAGNFQNCSIEVCSQTLPGADGCEPFHFDAICGVSVHWINISNTWHCLLTWCSVVFVALLVAMLAFETRLVDHCDVLVGEHLLIAKEPCTHREGMHVHTCRRHARTRGHTHTHGHAYTCTAETPTALTTACAWVDKSE